MSDSFKSKTLNRKNKKGLALTAPKPAATAPSDGDSQVPGAVGNRDAGRTDTLEIGLEFQLDLKSQDLVVLKELGAGNGGTVSKVMHATTKVVMAKKIIRVDAKENVRKQIVRELQVCQECSSPYVITFYGAFQNEARDIVLCMEYMDCGALDRISKDFGPVRVDVLGKITESILGGLVYLYEAHRIMHRDIKPSNVLVNSRGQIKLCDFGVATETAKSVADTFVGTATYMAPERIMGAAYTVRSDVWSVGLTVMELAIGRFPFESMDSTPGDRASMGPMGILDLLQTIVHEPSPRLPKSDAFPAILDDFIAKCLIKNTNERPTPRELYDSDSFLQAAKRTPVDLQEWAVSLMEKNNRKSYLAPPAPKSLRSDSTGGDSRHGVARELTQSPTTARRFASPTTEQPDSATMSPSRIITPRQQSGYNNMPLSMQGLSLESSNTSPHLQRYPSEPQSAIEPGQRPFFPERTTSTNSIGQARYNPQHPTLQMRAPPPSGPLPTPPMKDLPAAPLRNAGLVGKRTR